MRPASLQGGQVLLLQAALGSDRTLEELRRVCPDLTAMPYGWTGILPLLLSRRPDSDFRAEELAVLQQRRAERAAHSLLLRQVAVRCLDELERAGVAVVLLKGLAVADPYYPEFALRPMGDFDLLVKPEQLERAQQVLQAAGWRAELEAPGGLQARHATPFVHPTGVQLDLHWYSLGSCCWPEADQMFWRHSRPVATGMYGRVLCPAHNLLHLCAHGVVSGWNGLWAADCCLLLAAEPVDWAELEAEAERRQLVPGVVQALSFLRISLGAPVPEPWLARWRDKRPSWSSRLYAWCRSHPRHPAAVLLTPLLQFARGRQAGLGLGSFFRQRWGLRPGQSLLRSAAERIVLNWKRWRPVQAEPEIKPVSETAKPDRKQKVAEWLRSFAEEPGLEQVRQFWTPTDRSHAEQLIHPAHNDPVWTQASCQLVLTPTVLDRLDPMHQKRALEIGCGLGRILKPLSFLFEHCYGVDISSEMLRLGQEFLVGVERVETLLCDGRSLPIGDGQVDLVYSVICFQHLPARRVVQTYLEESFRVLRPGGLVRVQTVDVHLQPVQLGPHYGGAGYAYPSLDSFCEDLRGAGFTILEQERSDSGYLCATGLKAPI